MRRYVHKIWRAKHPLTQSCLLYYQIHLLLINNAHEEADLRHPIRADLAKALMDHAQYTEADALYQGLHELDVVSAFDP